MKILRVIGSMNPSSGGPCQGIRNSIPELENQGIQNEVVCLDEPTSSFISKDNFLIHALGPGKGPWNFSGSLIPWLLDNLNRFDAVIVHGLWLYHSYAVRKAFNQFKRYQKNQISGNVKLPKLFIMPHGMLDPYFQKASGRKLKAIRNWIYWKLIEADVVNEADGVLFTCEAELKLAREPFEPYRPKSEVNVGYGIAPPPVVTTAMHKAFQEKCLQLREQSYILFLSRIHEKKGIDLLLKAYAEVVRAANAKKEVLLAGGLAGGVNVVAEFEGHTIIPKLVIAGPGMDSLYGTCLQQLVLESKELKDTVFFPGMLTGEAKWGAFYGCEAFILPSHQENFGIAVVEAMACGKPVLISDQVNIWREIETSGGGLISPDTEEGVVNLLKMWLSLTDVGKKYMGEKALDAYQQKFAVSSAARKLVEALLD